MDSNEYSMEFLLIAFIFVEMSRVWILQELYKKVFCKGPSTPISSLGGERATI